MKKTLIATVISVLILSTLTACSGSKWNKFDPNMPEELVQKHRQIIDENLGLVEEDPEDLKAIFEVGYRYQQLGEYKNAVKYYEKVLELSEKHYSALSNLAAIYEEVEEYDIAAEYIKELYVNNETDIEVIKDTVRMLLEAGEPNNAQDALENFSTKRGSEEEGMTQLVSDLYQSIFDYRQQHEQN